MDSEGRKFGAGPRELNGAVDLISHYKLSAHHDFFCKRSLPAAISDTHYLHNVVGDTEIRKGEGMELDQLVRGGLYSRLQDTASAHMRPFDLETLGQAFQLKETTPVDLPSSEKGIPTISGKSKSSSKDKDKDKKHKKHKDKDKDKEKEKEKDRDKDKEHKKHKHRHKDKERSKDKERDKDKERKKDKNSQHDSGGDHSKKHHDKKRKHEGVEDSADNHKHKRSKGYRSR